MPKCNPETDAEVIEFMRETGGAAPPGQLLKGASDATGLARGAGMNAGIDRWLTVDAIPVHEARVMTEGGLLAGIVLDGQVYSLRITCSGMLILTK